MKVAASHDHSSQGESCVQDLGFSLMGSDMDSCLPSSPVNLLVAYEGEVVITLCPTDEYPIDEVLLLTED